MGASASTTTRWFLRVRGRDHGPYPRQALAGMARDGRLSRSSLLVSGRTEEELRADQLPELFTSPDPVSATAALADAIHGRIPAPSQPPSAGRVRSGGIALPPEDPLETLQAERFAPSRVRRSRPPLRRLLGWLALLAAVVVIGLLAI